MNYNEEDKDDESFKKPTPQKHRKYSDESDSTPMSNGDFKISLDRNSRNLRRSSRSKNQPSYKGIKKSKDERKNRKRIKAQDLMSGSIKLIDWKLSDIPSIETYMYLGKRN